MGERYTVYKKEDNELKVTFESKDILFVYQMFASMMLLKLHKSPRISKMTDHTNYDGTRTITFYSKLYELYKFEFVVQE